MIAILAAVLLDTPPAPAPTDLFAVYAELNGACWQAPMGNNTTDTHCFSVALDHKLAMDVHKVRDAAGKVIYEGVTLIRQDKAGDITYDYYNSMSMLITGTAVRKGSEIAFTMDIKGVETSINTWILSDKSYDVVSPKGDRRTFIKTAEPAGGL